MLLPARSGNRLLWLHSGLRRSDYSLHICEAITVKFKHEFKFVDGQCVFVWILFLFRAKRWGNDSSQSPTMTTDSTLGTRSMFQP